MRLWPVLLWPKPKAKQHTQQYGNRNINFHLTTRACCSTPATPATITITKFLYTFVINAFLLITSTWGVTVNQQQQQQILGNNYGRAVAMADGDGVMSALTGLSNGYATANYMKNYYQLSDSEAFKQQQIKQQQQHLNKEDLGTGRGFMDLPLNFYGNSIVARAVAAATEGAEMGAPVDGFNAYDGGFVPTTFTAAGQHYAASLEGIQSATDKSQYAVTTTAANKNNLHANYQPYANVNSNSNSNNDIVAEVNNNKAQQHSLFRRLANYGGGLNNGALGSSDDGDAGISTTTANFAVADNESGDGISVGVAGGDVAATGTAEIMQNYELTYADDAQSSALLQNFYNQQQAPYNDATQTMQEQTFANYFPTSMAAATAGYDIENQQKYYSVNNYQQTTKPPQYEQQQYAQYHKQQQQQQQPHELQQQQHQQTFNKQEMLTVTPPPEIYYQTYIQHKNDNNKEHYHHHHQQQQQHQYRNMADGNYNRWKQNQIMANYPQTQTAIEKQHQQQQQQQQQKHLQQTNQYQQHHLVQEPETAETSHSARIKKSPKHKSKRHDNHDKHDEHNLNYDILLEQNDNTIDHAPIDYSNVQFQQLERLQEQLQHQQQQFIELQHQLIDHDQQLQIQKHIANNPPPALPPITQTVHHNPHSLQALAGSPLSKHTHVIKTIPIPQHHQVHVPYRENVTVEVPQPVITPIRKPFAIQIPVTRTVTVPKIQEVKIPIEKVKPFPVERPIPYIVERRVPYTVEKQIAKPVYYPVPIKVPILHTVIHKLHKPQQHHQPSFHLPHTVYRKTHGHGHSHFYVK